ncbi:MAG: hypothetical protein QXI58_00600 [Candidatus Micrarchaeia archaeon]
MNEFNRIKKNLNEKKVARAWGHFLGSNKKDDKIKELKKEIKREIKNLGG